MQGTRRPVVVVDFTDELTRQLASAKVSSIIREYIEAESCVDTKGAAKLLGVCDDEFRGKHSRKIPVVELGLGAKGNRYRIADILKYRDSKTKQPKH